MSHASPFHEGELAVQHRLGETDEARRNGRAISARIVRGALAFVAAQPFAVVATRRRDGAPWASVLYGTPGFVRAPDERRLKLDLELLAPDPPAPWLEHLEHDARLGLLFLEPETRRRLRVNGRASRAGSRLSVAVVESYPNCPKYIRPRRLAAFSAGRTRAPSAGELDQRSGVALGQAEQALVRACDTFFVASWNPAGELDVSHRGGAPGFVRLLDERTLLLPDYPGNHMYNTLGNLTLDPLAGLAFVDFEHGRHLASTSRAEILLDVEASETESAGTRRFLRLTIEEWRSWNHPWRSRWLASDGGQPG
jgi:hypothetical protein